MIHLVFFPVQSTFQFIANLPLPVSQIAGKGYVKDKIHVPLSLDHPEIVKGEPFILLLQQGLAALLQPLQLRIVGDHGIVVDHQMDIVAALAFPLHIIDEGMAFQGIFPAVHLHMEAGKLPSGAVVVDHQIMITQNLGL